MEREAYVEKLRNKLAMTLDVYERATAPDAPLDIALKAVNQMENRVYGQARQTIEVQPDTRTDQEIIDAVKAKQKALGLDPG